jgi:DNA-binding NarL/FixJ family response regulator
MLRAGAKGYLLKDCDEKDFLAAVRAVAVGKGWLSPEVSDAVLDDYRKHVTNPIDLLSPREREVLTLIAEGHTSKEIGGILDISPRTAEHHRARLMEKLQADRVADLFRLRFSLDVRRGVAIRADASSSAVTTR